MPTHRPVDPHPSANSVLTCTHAHATANTAGDLHAQAAKLKTLQPHQTQSGTAATRGSHRFETKFPLTPPFTDARFVRVPSRSILPPWGSIRFRLAPRTYAPWGVRVVSQTKSRILIYINNAHPKQITALFPEQGRTPAPAHRGQERPREQRRARHLLLRDVATWRPVETEPAHLDRSTQPRS